MNFLILVHNRLYWYMRYLKAMYLFQSLPNDLQQEAIDFMEFLIKKRKVNVKQESSSHVDRKPGIRRNLIKFMSADFDAPLDIEK